MAGMNRIGWAILVVFFSLGNAMATEEAKYTVILKDDIFELRQYEPHIVAETFVEGDFEGAGNKAFSLLFKYISGNNQAQQEVAMTAPVSQGPVSEKIDMTSPVSQQGSTDKGTRDKWAVSFMMPSSYSLKTLPLPSDANVVLRQVPARYMAAITYSGFWNEKGYRTNLNKLNSWIATQNFDVVGDPIWARYDAPFVPWFMRRNEVLIPVNQ